MTCFVIPASVRKLWLKKAPKLYMHKVKIGPGGYEIGTGTYWGVGAPLYRVECLEGEYWSEHLRAASRDDAKRQIIGLCKTFGVTPTFFR